MIYENVCDELGLDPFYSLEEEAELFIQAFSKIEETLPLHEGIVDAMAAFFRKLKEMISRFFAWITGKNKEANKKAEEVDKKAKTDAAGADAKAKAWEHQGNAGEEVYNFMIKKDKELEEKI